MSDGTRDISLKNLREITSVIGLGSLCAAQLEQNNIAILGIEDDSVVLLDPRFFVDIRSMSKSAVAEILLVANRTEEEIEEILDLIP